MATKVKETPILTGKDAERFEKLTRNPKPISKEEFKRIMKARDTIKVIDSQGKIYEI